MTNPPTPLIPHIARSAPSSTGEGRDELVDSLDVRIDRRLPVSEQIYAALRDGITSMRLPPGTTISENRLCKLFQVSRTPVREAIIRLTKEEFIDVFPQQGSFVAPIKLTNVLEGHFIRETLEVAIIRKAAERWTPAYSRRIREIIAAQAEHAANFEVELFHSEDERFHQTFALCAGLDGVWRTIQGVKAHLDRVRRLAVPVAGHMDKIVLEHTAIVDALDAGNVEATVDALSYHLDTVNATIAKLVDRHSEYFE